MLLEAVDAQVGHEIRAAGAVLWRPAGRHGYRVAVVHRPRYDDWSLPKGKLDDGESAPAAAVREIAEETGTACVLGPFVTRSGYRVADIPKVVDYYGARATGGEFTPNDEVDEVRWLDPG
ncbi:MAG: NUDIX hydrolase, partial [Thermocrispum sp.]